MMDKNLTEGILFTDQYQLTMAQVYFRNGLHETPAQFDFFFRNYPEYYGLDEAGFCINAGMESLLEWMRNVRFSERELNFLKAQKAQNGKPLFESDFLSWLEKNGDYESMSIRAIPEGRVIHSNTPVAVFEGPLAMAQILETAALNTLNYQILIATKAARIREVCGDSLFLEFGARRGHDKGVNAGVRAALIGGADFSSNVGISQALGFEPKGTHAHSMVQAFFAHGMSEPDAFQAYAEVYPDDCLLLVDTVDTLASGIPNAIKVFEKLRQRGHKPLGIRLDSGDLAHLTVEASKMLNEAGFSEVKIFLSNELDEFRIQKIISDIRGEALSQGLDPDHIIARLAYGVGTKLITSGGDSALSGVYKFSALQKNGEWQPAIKISESQEKTPNPGDKQVFRIYDHHKKAVADFICLREEESLRKNRIRLIDAEDNSKYSERDRTEISKMEPLLEDVLSDGERVSPAWDISEIRERRKKDVAALEADVKKITDPRRYHVAISPKVWKLKQELIEQIKEVSLNAV